MKKKNSNKNYIVFIKKNNKDKYHTYKSSNDSTEQDYFEHLPHSKKRKRKQKF